MFSRSLFCIYFWAAASLLRKAAYSAESKGWQILVLPLLSPLCEGLFEIRREVQLWGLSVLWECRPAPRHRLKQIWSMSRGGISTCFILSQGSKNLARMRMGRDAAPAAVLGGCIGIRDARNITQAPLISTQFSFTTKPKRIILSHVCIVLRDFWLEKKL